MVRKINKDNPKNEKCQHCARWDKESGYCDATGTIRKEYQKCRWFEWSDEDEGR